MLRWTGRRRGGAGISAALLALGLGTGGAQALTLLDTATTGIAGQSSGVIVGAGQYIGAVFEVDAPMVVGSIGGHLLGGLPGATIFAAIVEAPSLVPAADPADLPTAALFSTLLTLPTTSSSVVSAPVDDGLGGDALIAAGRYAVVFGSGALGATGSAQAPQTGTTPTDSSPQAAGTQTVSFFFSSGSPSDPASSWTVGNLSGVRLFVEGDLAPPPPPPPPDDDDGGTGGGGASAVPLPAAGWMLLSALAGLGVMRRRRG